MEKPTKTRAISVRFTEDEFARLERGAAASRRSLNREVKFLMEQGYGVQSALTTTALAPTRSASTKPEKPARRPYRYRPHPVKPGGMYSLLWTVRYVELSGAFPHLILSIPKPYLGRSGSTTLRIPAAAMMHLAEVAGQYPNRFIAKMVCEALDACTLSGKPATLVGIADTTGLRYTDIVRKLLIRVDPQIKKHWPSDAGPGDNEE